jgi:hypothetical protein
MSESDDRQPLGGEHDEAALRDAEAKMLMKDHPSPAQPDHLEDDEHDPEALDEAARKMGVHRS